MSLMRIICRGRVNKPLPAPLVALLPAIKTNLIELQSYAHIINEGKPNEEATDKVVWGNEVDHIWWRLDLAIPLPLPQPVQDKLPIYKEKIRQLKQYAVNTGEAAFQGTWHLCNHEQIPPTCETAQEI